MPIVMLVPRRKRVLRSRNKALCLRLWMKKFNRLEKEYGIMCELEDTLTSLGFAIQALMQSRGLVQKSQVDDNGELVIELKAVEILSPGKVRNSRPRASWWISARPSRRAKRSYLITLICSLCW